MPWQLLSSSSWIACGAQFDCEIGMVSRSDSLARPGRCHSCSRRLKGRAPPLATGNAGTGGEADSLAADPLSPLAVAFEVELGYEVGRKICNLYDRKGILFVNWAE